uniref:Uncharacterized protein n=1 Tax=Anguilla anguilla TaxID=7936 RepID=A0A0E9QIL5_ANGAN
MGYSYLMKETLILSSNLTTIRHLIRMHFLMILVWDIPTKDTSTICSICENTENTAF